MPHSKVRLPILTSKNSTFGKLVNKTTFAKNLKGFAYKNGIEITLQLFK
jgi:hypothetical protein